MKDLIQTIKVLEENELKLVNNYIDTLQFSESLVFSNQKNLKIDISTRSSLGVQLDENHEVTKIIHEKINESLLEYRKRLIQINRIFEYYPVPGGYYTSSNREGIQALEYYKNQEYKFHHDTANDISIKEYNRIISVVLYLNNEFEGGGTEFSHQVYKPSPGYGLFFPSNWCFPHSGQKVLRGKKRVVVTWYYVIENIS